MNEQELKRRELEAHRADARNISQQNTNMIRMMNNLIPQQQKQNNMMVALMITFITNNNNRQEIHLS